MGVGVSLALGLTLDTRSDTSTVIRERAATGPPCVRLANGKPSKGCDRLAQLLIETCTLQPTLCAETVERVVARAPQSVRRQIVRAVDRGLRAPLPPRTSTTPAPQAPSTQRGEAPEESVSPGEERAEERPSLTPAPSAPAAPSSPAESSPAPEKPRDIVRETIERAEELADSVTSDPVETPSVTVTVPTPTPLPDVEVEIPTTTVPLPDVDLPLDGAAEDPLCVPTPVQECP